MSKTGYQKNRREFMKRCGAGAAGLALAGCSEESGKDVSKKKPSIIFILADDLGYGELGCYGQKNIKTPNIDNLASEGVIFTDHYAGSTVCAPSRSCLMTGLHTGHTHVRGNRGRGNERVPLRPEDITVAEVLKKAGYTTGIIGKWGLGEPDTTGIPNRQGFDYWFGYLNQHNAHNYYPEFLWKNEQKYLLEGNVVKDNVASKRAQYSHDLFTSEALEFIKRNKDDPFFLYLAYTIPHANNEAGEAGMEVPSDAPYSNRDWQQPQKNHASMITRMDSDIGKLTALLEELDIDENTIVFFTSDNGPHREGGADPEFFDSNGHLRGIKRDLYEGGIRVPMIARWQGKIKGGRVTGHVSAFWDFLPTAAEIAGTGVPADIDGISYLPAILGEKQKEHEFLYWEFHEGKASKQAVRMGKWKAVRHRLSEPLELYDLSIDIGETKNCAEEYPDIVKKIETFLKTARTESEYWGLGET